MGSAKVEAQPLAAKHCPKSFMGPRRAMGTTIMYHDEAVASSFVAFPSAFSHSKFAQIGVVRSKILLVSRFSMRQFRAD